MPVLCCEGTSRMTRAASDCTSEHGKNYFDLRLMSDMGMFRQRSAIDFYHRCVTHMRRQASGGGFDLRLRGHDATDARTRRMHRQDAEISSGVSPGGFPMGRLEKRKMVLSFLAIRDHSAVVGIFARFALLSGRS